MMTNADCRGIWVFAEQDQGTLCPAVLELLAKARELKQAAGSSDPVTAGASRTDADLPRCRCRGSGGTPKPCPIQPPNL